MCAFVHLAAAQSYTGVGVDIGYFARSGGWSDLYGASPIASARVEIGFKRNYYAAIRAGIMFGDNVKTDVLRGLRNEFGNVIGDNGPTGQAANITLKPRGVRYSAILGYQHKIGKLGWGYRAGVGPSYIVHNIRVQTDAEQPTSNLFEDYKRGYDRRAAGFGATSEAGISFINRIGTLQVYVVGTLDYAATKPLNSVQFDLLQQAPSSGNDVALGVRAGFILGLVRNNDGTAEDIYY